MKLTLISICDVVNNIFFILSYAKFSITKIVKFMSHRKKKSLQRSHIEALVAVAEHGSIHTAAMSMKMSQPALSRLLVEAEARLEGRIFERSVNGTTPTAQGRYLIAQARFTLRSIERLDHMVDPAKIEVKLGCIPRAMHSLMPHILNRLHSQSSGDQLIESLSSFRLNVTEDSSFHLLDQIHKDKLDFAILRHTADTQQIIQNFCYEKLYDERPVIISAYNNSRFSNKVINIKELLTEEWILPSIETTSRLVLDKFWMDLGLPPIRSVIETRTFESNLALVTETPFISIVPESLARRHESLKLIKILDVQPRLPASAVMLVYNNAIKDDMLLESCRELIHKATHDSLKNNLLA